MAEHRVVIEYIENRPPVVYDCSTQEEAQEKLMRAKQDCCAWHVYYLVRESPDHPGKVMVSLYRTYTADWSTVRG